MYDVRFSMYDLDFSSPAARRGRTGRAMALSSAYVRGTMYDCQICARDAGIFAEPKRTGCPKAVIGRGYKGAGFGDFRGEGMENGWNELGANFIGRRVDGCGVCRLFDSFLLESLALGS